MEVFHRAYSQLRDSYRSMTPGSRLTTWLLAAVLVGALAYLGTQQVAKPDTDLMHGAPIARSQLPLMEAAFDKAKLKGGYVIRGSSILVPHGEESKYMAALVAANALPPRMGAAGQEALNGNSWMEMGSGRDQQRMRIAKQKDLAQAIRLRPGIEDATVDYDVDSRPGPFKDKVATAVVCVKPAGTNQLDEATVLAIRDMVVGAFAGLKPEEVVVADSNGGTWRGPMGTAEENQYRLAKRTSEQDLKTRILKALDNIPNVDVQVTVELKREQAASARAASCAAAPAVPRQESSPSGASVVSQRPNVAAVLDSLLSGTSGEGRGSSSERTGTAASESIEKAPIALTPISARVLVRVPMSYFTSVWQQRNPVEGGAAKKAPEQAVLDQIRIEESTNIQRCVAALLPPIRDGASLAEQVTVTPFVEISATTPAFSIPEDVLNWAAQSWQTLAAAGITLVCLLGLWLIARAKPAKADEPAMPVAAEPPTDASPPTPAKVAAPHWRRHTRAADRPLREELSKLVEDDPETAANILRKWIGQVS